MPLINHCNGGSSFAAVIQVTYNTGAVCTCTNGSTTLTAPDTSGSVNFKVKRAGAWTVSVSKDGQTSTVTVNVTEDGSVIKVSRTSYKVFGISRDITNSSPAWARTDDAVGLSATASKGTIAGSSDFDAYSPWSNIERVTLSTGDVMVRIPKFWYHRYRSGNVEHIKISGSAAAGFTLHPAFNHGNSPKDYIDIAAYYANKNMVSKSGVSDSGLYSGGVISDLWSKATQKGSGWHIMDMSALSAIQMLILVEFADNNVQAVIGRGNAETYTIPSAGACDSVPGLTGIPAGTDGQTSVVWRGIENLWGGYPQLINGMVMESSIFSVSNTPDKYNANSYPYFDSYSELSYSYPSIGTSKQYITRIGFDPNCPWAMLPAEASGGSGTTFMCDTTAGDIDAGYTYPVFSPGTKPGDATGLFGFSNFFTSGTSSPALHLRTIHIP